MAFNWDATPTRTGNVYYPATNQFGCSAWTGADAANIAGRIVLIDWKIGNNAVPVRLGARGANAAAAGAIGIIMADSTTFLDTAITGSATVPAMYTNVNVGQRAEEPAAAGRRQPGGQRHAVDARIRRRRASRGRTDELSGFSLARAARRATPG